MNGMRLNRLIVALGLIVVGAIACQQPALQPAGTPVARPPTWFVLNQVRPNSIVGKVVNDSGAPMFGAQVLLDTNRRTFTDSSGRFTFLNVPAASYTIRVLRVGFVQGREVARTVDGSGLAIVIQLHPSPYTLDEICTMMVEPNVNVVVHPVRLPEALSSAAFGIPRGLVIRVVDGSYDDTMYGDSLSWSRDNDGNLSAQSHRPGERAGVYTVEVSAPGFRHWKRTGIRVTKEGCHVDMQTVDVTLEPMTTKHERSLD